MSLSTSYESIYLRSMKGKKRDVFVFLSLTYSMKIFSFVHFPKNDIILFFMVELRGLYIFFTHFFVDKALGWFNNLVFVNIVQL